MAICLFEKEIDQLKLKNNSFRKQLKQLDKLNKIIDDKDR